MPSEIITEQVDLLNYPKNTIPLKQGDNITIGDLHGNALKFLFFLIKQDILSLPNQQDDYNEIIKIYNNANPNKEDLDKFKQILDSTTINKSVNQTNPKIRLIGDEVADRGSNDYFTLLILEKLKQNNIDTEIIFSNHGAEFVKFYEDGYSSSFVSNLWNPIKMDNQSASLGCNILDYGLIGLIKKNLVSKEELTNLINKSYKPKLKLLSYHIDDSSIPETFTLYSHAPIGIETIKGLATQLGVIYNDSNIHNFAKTIDQINENFSKLVNQNNISKTLKQEKKINPNNKSTNAPLTASITRTIWNRFHHQKSDAQISIERPDELKGSDNKFKLRYVHGHDTYENKENHVINLDNRLGKTWPIKNDNQGTYVIEKTNSLSTKKKIDITFHEPIKFTEGSDNIPGITTSSKKIEKDNSQTSKNVPSIKSNTISTGTKVKNQIETANTIPEPKPKKALKPTNKSTPIIRDVKQISDNKQNKFVTPYEKIENFFKDLNNNGNTLEAEDIKNLNSAKKTKNFNNLKQELVNNPLAKEAISLIKADAYLENINLSISQCQNRSSRIKAKISAAEDNKIAIFNEYEIQDIKHEPKIISIIDPVANSIECSLEKEHKNLLDEQQQLFIGFLQTEHELNQANGNKEKITIEVSNFSPQDLLAILKKLESNVQRLELNLKLPEKSKCLYGNNISYTDIEYKSLSELIKVHNYLANNNYKTTSKLKNQN